MLYTGFVWNIRDYTVDWVKRMEDVLTQYYDNTPRAITRKWKTVLENYNVFVFIEDKISPGIPNVKVIDM